MKYLLGLIILAIFSLIISCNKFLDKKPTNSVNVPTKLEDLQALLDDASVVMNIGTTPCFGEASSDNMWVMETHYNTRPFFEQQFYIYRTAEYFFQNDWSRGYAPIYNANYCLETLQDIPVTVNNRELWNNIKGSSLFYRAYNFLNLTWNHCKAYDDEASKTDLGIVLRLGADFNVPSVRSTVKECYEQVIKDAKESITLLPEVPIHVFRPSKAAAYGLLARAYLSMRKYDSALKYSNLCLEINSNLIDLNGDADFLGAASSAPFKRFNKETIFYTDMYTFLSYTSTSRAKVDTLLYQSYSSDDWRKTAYFLSTSGYHRFKGSYSQGSAYFTGIATDEMYLTRAECYARNGQKDLALADLNMLLSKRWKTGTFVPLEATDAQEALEIILSERRKELIFRGLRWMDIKRLNAEGANIILTRKVNGQSYTLEPNHNFYALPLPADIITIAGIPQNPY